MEVTSLLAQMRSSFPQVGACTLTGIAKRAVRETIRLEQTGSHPEGFMLPMQLHCRFDCSDEMLRRVCPFLEVCVDGQVQRPEIFFWFGATNNHPDLGIVTPYVWQQLKP